MVKKMSSKRNQRIMIETPSVEQEAETGFQENPLFNSLILVEIFKNLDLQELKVCRLVCQQWSQDAMPLVKKVASIRISSLVKMEEFCLLENLHGFNKYEINVLKDGNMMLIKFMRVVRPPIRELTLNYILLTDQILKCLSMYSSHLEFLDLEFCQRAYEIDTGCHFWERDPDLAPFRPRGQIFEPLLRFPKLQKLICKSIAISENGRLSQIIFGSPNLKEIVTDDCVVNSLFWSKLDLWTEKLERLSVGFLELRTIRSTVPAFPVFPKLKYFSAAGGNFTFPDGSETPNLESGKVDYAVLEKLFPIGWEGPASLTSLSLQKAYCKDWTGFTASKFPSLKILNFPAITNKLFRMVCKNLKTIEEFHVGSVILDFSITGLPRYQQPKVDIIVQEAKKKKKFNVAKYKKYPGLADLPHLTKFKIICTSRSNTRLTEGAILLGLIYCKSLTSLEIESTLSEISIPTLHAIADNLPGLKKLHLRADNFFYDGVVANACIGEKLPECRFITSSY